ncbi:MAG: hypothetical protein LAN83_10685 [Acidobacteriia bacterium]|nr:hypothetical protein [Terriglobia bacterium]
MSRMTVWSATWVVALSLAAFAGGEGPRTFHGEIADSQCSMNVHSLTRSHQEMLKSKSMGGTSLSCTLYCIRYLGGDLVLSSKKEVYRLDDQDSAKRFIGQKVKISGTLEPKTNTIHVVKIETD